MDNNMVMKRCRKVFIQTNNKKIFSCGYDDHEYDFVNVFKDEKKASVNLGDRQTNYITDNPASRGVKREVIAFYLVPVVLVENPNGTPRNKTS